MKESFTALADTLTKSTRILITFPAHDQGESVGSALALKHFLEQQGKNVTVAAPDFLSPRSLQFLPGVETIQGHITGAERFAINLAFEGNALKKAHYEIKNGLLTLEVTPEKALLNKTALRSIRSTLAYDLIVTLNTSTLERLEDIYTDNTELFSRVPIVNIDRLSSNTRFGAIALVDTNVISIAETLYYFLKSYDANRLDARVATALLTTMIVATKSFKSANVTPEALTIGSELIKLGGERETVIHNLYRTRSLETLKLWGQALTHLHNEENIGLLTTTLTRAAIAEAGGGTADLEGVVAELISNSPNARLIAVLYEDEREPTKIHGLLAAEHPFSSTELLGPFQPTGDRKRAFFTLSDTTLNEAETTIIRHLRSKLNTAP